MLVKDENGHVFRVSTSGLNTYFNILTKPTGLTLTLPGREPVGQSYLQCTCVRGAGPCVTGDPGPGNRFPLVSVVSVH